MTKATTTRTGATEMERAILLLQKAGYDAYDERGRLYIKGGVLGEPNGVEAVYDVQVFLLPAVLARRGLA